MHEVAKQLDLNPNRFPIFAALLGRWAVRKLLRLIGFYAGNTLVFLNVSAGMLRSVSFLSDGPYSVLFLDVADNVLLLFISIHLCDVLPGAEN